MNKQTVEALLQPHRDRIDILDKQIVKLLCDRFQVIHDVAVLKSIHNIPAVLPDRIKRVIGNASEMANELGEDAELVRQIYTVIVGLSCDLEEDVIASTDIFSPERDHQHGNHKAHA